MTAFITIYSPKWTDYVSSWFRAPVANRASIETDLEAAKVNLIDAIQNGYIDEETGDHAQIPRFAQTYLTTLVESGDA